MIQNSKNDSHCQAITYQSIMATIDLPIHMVDDVRNDIIEIDKANKDKTKRDLCKRWLVMWNL